MANIDSILKSRDITLPTKVCLVKAIVEGNYVTALRRRSSQGTGEVPGPAGMS